MASQIEVMVLHNTTRQAVVANRMYRPRSLHGRLLGLILWPPLSPDEALWLNPCGAVHTWGMHYAIDVLFLDAELRILGVKTRVRPRHVVFAPKGTASVVEMRAGRAGDLAVGDQLSVETKHAPRVRRVRKRR